MSYVINVNRARAAIDPMIYGSFLEHFHRQIYGGIYDPSSRFADEDGFRGDVLEAIRALKTPVIRWPGGCFVDDYHWKLGVGAARTPSFDKNWKVEEPNIFGTDEFMKFCKKVGCEPYLCTNATATPEEASEWVEYCNLRSDGQYARARIANGFPEPHNVKYWSIGNENYYRFQVGGMGIDDWLRYSEQSAKVMKRVDPSIELSVAMTTSDINWSLRLLETIGDQLDWVSLHGYWDFVYMGSLGFSNVSDVLLNKDPKNAGYEACMARIGAIPTSIDKMRGLLRATGFEHKIKIAFDEWNLRGWFHPYIMEANANHKEGYLPHRDRNDENQLYTMADAVFSGAFLNACLRNADIVGMANFSPLVNTRGAIFTHKDGIVKRSTYHVFDLYMRYFGDMAADIWTKEPETYVTDGATVPVLDVAAATRTSDGAVTVAAANKDDKETRCASFVFEEGFAPQSYSVYTVNGEDKDSYNDVGRDEIGLRTAAEKVSYRPGESIKLEPHSVNIIVFQE